MPDHELAAIFERLKGDDLSAIHETVVPRWVVFADRLGWRVEVWQGAVQKTLGWIKGSALVMPLILDPLPTHATAEFQRMAAAWNNAARAMLWADTASPDALEAALSQIMDAVDAAKSTLVEVAEWM